LDVLHCVLIDSPEALNVIKEQHIRTVISLIDKHGRDPKVKKRSEETQTPRAGYSKVEPKFSTRRRPPSRGAQNGQNLISWRR